MIKCRPYWGSRDNRTRIPQLPSRATNRSPLRGLVTNGLPPPAIKGGSCSVDRHAWQYNLTEMSQTNRQLPGPRCHTGSSTLARAVPIDDQGSGGRRRKNRTSVRKNEETSSTAHTARCRNAARGRRVPRTHSRPTRLPPRQEFIARAPHDPTVEDERG